VPEVRKRHGHRFAELERPLLLPPQLMHEPDRATNRATPIASAEHIDESFTFVANYD
jgi:hypothetical protein